MTAVRAKRYLRTNRLDIVAVGIDQERGVVSGAVIGPRAGGAVVAAAGLHALGMEFLDRGVVGRAERDMGPGSRRPLLLKQPQGRFALGPEARVRILARAQHIAERCQGCRVEAHAGVEILNLQSDVVVHDDLRWKHVRTTRGQETTIVSAGRAVLGKSCASRARPRGIFAG